MNLINHSIRNESSNGSSSCECLFWMKHHINDIWLSSDDTSTPIDPYLFWYPLYLLDSESHFRLKLRIESHWRPTNDEVSSKSQPRSLMKSNADGVFLEMVSYDRSFWIHTWKSLVPTQIHLLLWSLIINREIHFDWFLFYAFIFH